MSLKLKQVSLENGLVKNFDPRAIARPPEPGEWWYADIFWDPKKNDGENFIIRGAKRFSEDYWKAWADKRPPIFVVLPSGEHWSPDMAFPVGTGQTVWIVTGKMEPGIEPAWQVTPSIQTPNYHGYLNRGELTDDLEGRTYDPKPTE